MKFGIWLPFSHAQWVAQMARLAEQSGWDGVFLREEVVGLDRWIPIAAAALGTQRILLGGLISLTSQDNVIPALKEAYRIHRRSGFRLVVCLGNRLKGELSAPDNSSLGRYPSSRVDELGDDDTPALWLTQRLVVWRIGLWPHRDSIQRSLNYQGLIPVIKDKKNWLRAPTRAEITEIVQFISRSNCVSDPFEVVVEMKRELFRAGTLSGQVKAWEAAGATWWVVNSGETDGDAESMKRIEEIIRRGPPG